MKKRTTEPPAKRLYAVLAALLLAISCVNKCMAQANESEVKAAFLYKFVNYIEWPPRALKGPESTLLVGVLGADAIADNLEQLINARPNGSRPVMVKKLRRGDPLTGLHVLFISGSDSGRLSETLAATRGLAVLTVTESEQALMMGSIINFVIVEDKVRFDVAPPPPDPGNLKVSARLLAVARKVVPSPS